MAWLNGGLWKDRGCCLPEARLSSSDLLHIASLYFAKNAPTDADGTRRNFLFVEIRSENRSLTRARHVVPLQKTQRVLERLRDDDGGEAAEFGVGGDELGVVGVGGGVEDCVGEGEAVIQA
jgi:hypothetical protein